MIERHYVRSMHGDTSQLAPLAGAVGVGAEEDPVCTGTGSHTTKASFQQRVAGSIPARLILRRQESGRGPRSDSVSLAARRIRPRDSTAARRGSSACMYRARNDGVNDL